jgi:hypothetical protein
MNDASTEDHSFDLLHVPGRKDNLEDVYNHLNTAARLSRILWNELSNPELDLSDERDREAMVELASIVADHASAAEAVLNKGCRARTDAAAKSKDSGQ